MGLAEELKDEVASLGLSFFCIRPRIVSVSMFCNFQFSSSADLLLETEIYSRLLLSLRQTQSFLSNEVRLDLFSNLAVWREKFL